MMQPISGFAIVKSGQVYRGSQPYTSGQWNFLKDLGVRTVLKLNYDSEGKDDGAPVWSYSSALCRRWTCGKR